MKKQQSTSSSPAPASSPSAGARAPAGRGNAAAQQRIAGPRSQAEAEQRRGRNQAMVRRAIDYAAAIEPAAEDLQAATLRNTGQWLARQPERILVLSPIHNPEEHGASAGQRLLYSTLAPGLEAPAAYPQPASPGQQGPGLRLDDGVAGHSQESSGQVAVMDPLQRSEEELLTTLVHEVQHQADLCDEGQALYQEPPTSAPGPGVIDPAPAATYAHARTELNARHSADREPSQAPAGPFPLSAQLLSVLDSPEVAVGSVHQVMISPQEAGHALRLGMLLAEGLLKPGAAWRGPEGSYKGHYGDIVHHAVFDAGFRGFLEGMITPGQGNGLNSVRVDALLPLFQGATFLQFQQAADALDEFDRQWLADRQGSAAFWAQVPEEPAEEERATWEHWRLCMQYLCVQVLGVDPPARA